MKVMKRYSFGATIALALCLLASAARARNEINVQGLRVERQGDHVMVSFVGEVGRNAVSDGQTLSLTPVVYVGGQKAQLPAPIIIRSNKASISDARREMSSGRPTDYPAGTIVTANGGSISYKGEIPYQDWMDGSSLRFDRMMTVCNSSRTIESVVIADNVFSAATAPAVVATPAPAPAPVVVPPPAPVVTPQPAPGPAISERPVPAPAPVFAERPAPISTAVPPSVTPAQPVKPLTPYLRKIPTSVGSDLSRRFPFISSVTALNKRIGGAQGMTTENALAVYFPQGRSVIDPAFADNDKTLRDLIYTVNAINASSDSNIATIFVAGFASPEGSYATNEALAQRRAEALQTFILRNTSASGKAMMLYNGSEDWDGLRQMVAASDMPLRAEVLRIIDNVPIWDASRQVGREGELMRLDGGSAYRYMLTNFFPKLRNATYVKVVYDERTDDAATTINRAIDQIEANDYTGALTTLRQVDSDPRAYNPIGVCYMMTGDFDKAKQYFDKAIASGNNDARTNLFQILTRQMAVKN